MRAVERTVNVLKALRTDPPVSLEVLHRRTSLPRPTLLRILQSLVESRMVRRGLSDGNYRLTTAVADLAMGLTDHDRLIDCATPVLEALCVQIGWPSDLAVFGEAAGDYMQIAETSLLQSRFFITRPTAGVKVNLLGSAVGIAYLSALPAAERNRILVRARIGKDPNNLRVIADGKVGNLIVAANKAGYATRHPLFIGGRYGDNPADDGLAAIAVPVRCQSICVGVVSITWKRRAMDEIEMVRLHLDKLQAAAKEIACAVEPENRSR